MNGSCSSQISLTQAMLKEEAVHSVMEYQMYLRNVFKEKSGELHESITPMVLDSVAEVFRDQTAATIIKGMKDVQELEMLKLHEKYGLLKRSHRLEMSEMKKRHRVALDDMRSRPHNLSVLKKDLHREFKNLEFRHSKEVETLLKEILTASDETVRKQQEYLKSIGIPLFYVTSDHEAIDIQMQLIAFIWQLISAFKL